MRLTWINFSSAFATILCDDFYFCASEVPISFLTLKIVICLIKELNIVDFNMKVTPCFILGYYFCIMLCSYAFGFIVQLLRLVGGTWNMIMVYSCLNWDTKHTYKSDFFCIQKLKHISQTLYMPNVFEKSVLLLIWIMQNLVIVLLLLCETSHLLVGVLNLLYG